MAIGPILEHSPKIELAMPTANTVYWLALPRKPVAMMVWIESATGLKIVARGALAATETPPDMDVLPYLPDQPFRLGIDIVEGFYDEPDITRFYVAAPVDGARLVGSFLSER